MNTVARVFVGIVALFLVATMFVYALISLPEGDPALALLGNPPWIEDMRALNRTIPRDRHVAVRYVMWLGRVVRYLAVRARQQRSPSPAVGVASQIP